MIAGADLLIAADIAARLVPTQGEIRIGVMTALIGVPFFIWLVLSGAGGIWCSAGGACVIERARCFRVARLAAGPGPHSNSRPRRGE